MSSFVSMGEGNIICAGNILTVNVVLGDFVILNLSCTVGHDAVIESFVTVYPGVNISGCVKIGQGVELGTGSKIIQGIAVGSNSNKQIVLFFIFENILTPSFYKIFFLQMFGIIIHKL